MADVRRNDPCPCGSGKKYKRCCLRNEADAAARARDQEDRNGALALLHEFVDRFIPTTEMDDAVGEFWQRKPEEFTASEGHQMNSLEAFIVLDNLNIHRLSALYDRFEPEEARRIASRLEFHFTPKHASWLNMVEIEIGVLAKQCLDRRIASINVLTAEVGGWNEARNACNAGIDWLFDVDDARGKLGKHYPVPTSRVAPQDPSTTSASPEAEPECDEAPSVEESSPSQDHPTGALARLWTELRSKLGRDAGAREAECA